jgi:hypothetical protein
MGNLKVIYDEGETADIVKEAISAEIKRLEIGLNKTNREIEKFEKQYDIPSEAFLKEYASEDLKGGDEEYIRWVGELKIRRGILEDLERLKNIEYAAH